MLTNCVIENDFYVEEMVGQWIGSWRTIVRIGVRFRSEVRNLYLIAMELGTRQNPNILFERFLYFILTTRDCHCFIRFCEAPASVAPYEWPDDITKWPICRKSNSRFPVQTSPYDQQRFQKDKMTAEHMVCEVIGHPCCIGIHGTCRITTKEYCDFVHGYFHEDASLCSQVCAVTSAGCFKYHV